MELRTISEVSRQFGVSTRTLRYYEQIGLIRPSKREDFSYRAYDRDTLLRLKQIIFLRKLRIPLKSIAEILLTENTALLMEVFRQSLREMDDEITALTTIKGVIASFLDRLRLPSARLQLLDDESLLEIVDSLTTSKINFKEDKTMEELNKASEKLSKLQDVRIIYLPPMTIASSHYIGSEPEGHSGTALDNFVKASGLLNIKPDVRHFGFNIYTSDKIPASGESSGGYAMWVSIPDNMEVPSPLQKIQFHGGLYAAHVITFGNFDHWGLLHNWVKNNDKYESDWGSVRCDLHIEGMDWAMEEQLNYLNNAQNPKFDYRAMQLDLLFPIKEKAVK